MARVPSQPGRATSSLCDIIKKEKFAKKKGKNKMQTRISEHFVGKCASPEMKVNAVSVFFLTCSSAEDLHHRRGEESNPVGPPLGVVDVTFPAAV